MFQENEIRFQLKSVLQLDMLFWPALEQLATALQYSYFSVMSLKQCSVFEIFLQFALPPLHTKLKLGKKFWIHASNIVCDVSGGVEPV